MIKVLYKYYTKWAMYPVYRVVVQYALDCELLDKIDTEAPWGYYYCSLGYIFDVRASKLSSACWDKTTRHLTNEDCRKIFMGMNLMYFTNEDIKNEV